MFGSTALLTKPGQTLAPLVGTFMISYLTGKDVFDAGSLSISYHPDNLVKFILMWNFFLIPNGFN